jgi:type I restriction enzyme S subunit
VRRLGSLLRERGEGNDHGGISHVLSLLRGRGVIPYDEKGNVGNKKSDDITRYKIVRPDDIVMNCMNVIIGSVGISRYTGCLSPVYYVLVRRNEADNPHYLNAVFQCSSFHKSLVRIGNGILAHRMRIPMELLKCELLPYPSCAEQTRIVEELRSATEAFDRVIARTEREMDLLREYRTRLVADVVTGKLDVREAAARLPDEAPLDSVEDDADPSADPEAAEEAVVV